MFLFLLDSGHLATWPRGRTLVRFRADTYRKKENFSYSLGLDFLCVTSGQMAKATNWPCVRGPEATPPEERTSDTIRGTASGVSFSRGALFSCC